MNEEIDKKGLMDLMIEVPASSIPIEKEKIKDIQELPDLNHLCEIFWSQKSNRLLSDYEIGENLALYGKNDLSLQVFFKRFASSFCSIISNEYQKRGTGAESLKPYYTILENILLIIAKEIEKKDLKDFEIYSIIAAMQGFLINYNNKRKDT